MAEIGCAPRTLHSESGSIWVQVFSFQAVLAAVSFGKKWSLCNNIFFTDDNNFKLFYHMNFLQHTGSWKFMKSFTLGHWNHWRQVDARTSSPEMVALCDPYDCGINAFFVPGARLAATTCLFLEQEEPRPCQAGHLWRLGILRWEMQLDVCHVRYPIGNHGLNFNLLIKGFLMVSVNFTFKHINCT